MKGWLVSYLISYPFALLNVDGWLFCWMVGMPIHQLVGWLAVKGGLIGYLFAILFSNFIKTNQKREDILLEDKRVKTIL